MGAYYYTYRKGIKTRKANVNGQEILVGTAEFAASHGYFSELKDVSNAAITRAYNIPKEDMAEFIAFGKYDGSPVYKNNKLGVWCDTPMWTGIKKEDLIGTMFKIKGKNHIVPAGTSVRDFMRTNFPKLFKTPLRSTQVHVKIHDGYTATVRDIDSFEDYVFGFGSDQVKYGSFQKRTSPEDVPAWFTACVEEVVNEKTLELIKEVELETK